MMGFNLVDKETGVIYPVYYVLNDSYQISVLIFDEQKKEWCIKNINDLRPMNFDSLQSMA